jgi:hypothetical protein
MTWFVEISSIAGDEHIVKAVLEGAGYEFVDCDDAHSAKSLLCHPKYEAFEKAAQVHEDAKQLSIILRHCSEIEEYELGIEFGSIEFRHPDGRIDRHIIAEAGTFSISASNVTMSGTATVTRTPDISEEEYRRLTAEAAERDAEQRRNAIIRRVSAAVQDPMVLEVMELMKIEEPSTTQLGHIVDLVREACNGKMDAFATRNELIRFFRSINHPEVFGLNARHAVSNEEPPRRPMDLVEATALAHRIGANWLAQFEASA